MGKKGSIIDGRAKQKLHLLKRVAYADFYTVSRMAFAVTAENLELTSRLAPPAQLLQRPQREGSSHLFSPAH